MVDDISAQRVVPLESRRALAAYVDVQAGVHLAPSWISYLHVKDKIKVRAGIEVETKYGRGKKHAKDRGRCRPCPKRAWGRSPVRPR